jgi:pyruvate-ferredoxin/flavodoxin oxidoreductase
MRLNFFKHTAPIGKEFFKDQEAYTLQVSVEDCTGCNLCYEVCPVESKTEPGHKGVNMQDVLPLKETERKNWDFFLSLPDIDRTRVNRNTVKGSQLLEPLFRNSPAPAVVAVKHLIIKVCLRCYLGEGERMMVAKRNGLFFYIRVGKNSSKLRQGLRNSEGCGPLAMG